MVPTLNIELNNISHFVLLDFCAVEVWKKNRHIFVEQYACNPINIRRYVYIS